MSAEKFADLNELKKLHGHICLGLAIGYRAGLAARQGVKFGTGKDHELFAVMEENTCCEDAIQLTTTCSFHRGNLVFQSIGKFVFIFYNHTTGKSLRLELKPEYLAFVESLHKLKERVVLQESTPEEEFLFHEKTKEYVDLVIQARDEDLFSLQQFDMTLLVKLDPHNSSYVTKGSLHLNTCPCGSPPYP